MSEIGRFDNDTDSSRINTNTKKKAKQSTPLTTTDDNDDASLMFCDTATEAEELSSTNHSQPHSLLPSDDDVIINSTCVEQQESDNHKKQMLEEPLIPWLLEMSLSRYRANETDDNRYLDNTETNYPPMEAMFLHSLDQSHFLSLECAVKHVDDDDKIMNEINLITNRLERLNIIADDTTSICPKHRSSLGIGWFQSKQCYHPDHDPKSPAHSADCRPASLDVSSRIQGFPVSGC
ncbi:unnamed protein product [Didymodactylos carnosus]|uniref:Uncharacterized protein n=1 Tax=Didymodactylos carnosus TaxID=1234261 RepID=A0A8S2DJM0_9BILA|nr:unnamed protein product [Didymodactylos carnosus]CAF3711029.1 unnamed protein product [Didymodactylos carnosus]